LKGVRVAAKKKVKKSDRVKVHYACMLSNGTMIDSSFDKEPLKFTVGERAVIAGLEKAVTGMSTGERKTTKVPAGLAYGPYHNEWVLEIGRDKLPVDMNPEVGLRVELSEEGDKSYTATIKRVSPSSVTLDFNHPLAGQELVFDITLLEIQSPKGR
jgi:FKBP-type peptidyl-prolyl cis-trans isomerase 2